MDPELIVKFLKYGAAIAGGLLFCWIAYGLIRRYRQKVRWNEFVTLELINKLRAAIRVCLPEDQIVTDFEIFPETWGNDLLSVKDNGRSHWMWVRSINVPGHETISFDHSNSTAVLEFKDGRVEINTGIDLKKITNALNGLLEKEGWPVNRFCIVACKGGTIYVYQFFPGGQLSNPDTYDLDLPISDVYQYLIH